MRVVTPGIEMTQGRHQPWDGGKDKNGEDRGTYYDFRRHPTLIETSLEDFVLLSHYPAVQKYYDLLRWINSEDSPFESNDSRLLPLDGSTMRKYTNRSKYRAGLLGFFFRNLRRNLSQSSADWFAAKVKRPNLESNYMPGKRLYEYNDKFASILQREETDPVDFFELWLYSVYYREAPVSDVMKFGHQFVWKFWMWGENDEEVMQNFANTVQDITICLKVAAKNIPK